MVIKMKLSQNHVTTHRGYIKSLMLFFQPELVRIILHGLINLKLKQIVYVIYKC